VKYPLHHPSEITTESAEAVPMLADGGHPSRGINRPLEGVNDDPVVMKTSNASLNILVRPYYIHQADLVGGTRSLSRSCVSRVWRYGGLQRDTPGLAVPSYMIEPAGAEGEGAVLPDRRKARGRDLLLRNYEGELVEY